mgnify:CR=1 FL=1
MSNFSKIVIFIIIVLSFFFIKEKTGFNFEGILSSFRIPQIAVFQKNDNKEIVKTPTEIIKTADEQLETINIYFLALDSNSNGIYKKVKREIPKGENKLAFALEELLKGPNIIEKTSGAYTEIPASTKLLGIKENGNKVIIDFSADFQYGGGTDSIYSRMMQLIKTSIENSDNKKVYLYLNGKQIKFIGGEGIMISQPLSEKSLEI